MLSKLLIIIVSLNWLVTPVAAQSDPDFPALSGRVVDTANLLDAADEASLTSQLEQHEQATSNQLVVVTISDLQGYAIADFANRLGRHWGIGQADLNNGALLVVAPTERKVRIEVGYGLEGALTDATSADIIRRQILPSFREDDYAGGIRKGVNSMLEAVAGEYEAQPVSSGSESNSTLALPFIGFIAAMQLLSSFRSSRKWVHSAFPAGFAGIFAAAVTGNIWLGVLATLVFFLMLAFVVKPGTGSTGSRGTGNHTQHRHGSPGRFGSGGGGFGGGGGSFGGGGASGSW